MKQFYSATRRIKKPWYVIIMGYGRVVPATARLPLPPRRGPYPDRRQNCRQTQDECARVFQLAIEAAGQKMTLSGCHPFKRPNAMRQTQSPAGRSQRGKSRILKSNFTRMFIRAGRHRLRRHRQAGHRRRPGTHRLFQARCQPDLQCRGRRRLQGCAPRRQTQ